MKKFRVLLLAAIVAVTMMAGSLAVFASDSEGTTASSEASSTVPTITKNVTLAEGVTMPATDFVFTATKTDNFDGVVAPSTAPASFTTTISGTETVGTTTNPNVFTGSIEIPAAITNTTGEYTYELAETAPAEGTNWTTVDDTTYFLHIYVKNDKTVLYSITDANTEEATKTDAEFDNVYEKKTSLTISKTVVNPEYVDESLADYTFTITFSDNGAATAPASVTGTKNGETITVENGATFTLKDGESVEFTELPVGVKYTLVETTPTDANYKETSIEAKNGETATTVTSTTLSNQLIGETTNSADVTNTYNEVTITGVIMNILPFVMMIAIGGAAAAMYVASRRRKMAR